MTATEPMGRGSEAVPAPLADLREALGEFLTEFKGLRSTTTRRLNLSQERGTMLSTKSFARPALSLAAHDEAPHQKAFGAYLRSGDDEGLRGLSVEQKGLNTAVSAEGGYLVDNNTAEKVQTMLRGTASLRTICTVVNVEASTFDVIVDKTDMGSGWATEAAAVAETATPVFERISIKLHELSAMPKASQRLLDDAAFDVEGWLAGRIADKFARAEAGAFINGDGLDKPKGFQSYPKVANATQSWGSLGYVVTGNAGDFATTNAGNAIIDLVYALPADYRANGTFLMNSKTAGAVRKMRDADGRFLWTDGLKAGEPAQLMGYPVLVSEDMPDIAAGSFSIAFGDFAAGYTVAERPGLRVLRDPFSAKPHVLFYASKRVGGDVTDFAAIKLLKFAAS